MKKYRIRCTLANASTSISGIDFRKIEDGVESIDFHPESVAERFRGISGYELTEEGQEKQKPRGRPRKQRGQNDRNES